MKNKIVIEWEAEQSEQNRLLRERLLTRIKTAVKCGALHDKPTGMREPSFLILSEHQELKTIVSIPELIHEGAE